MPVPAPYRATIPLAPRIEIRPETNSAQPGPAFHDLELDIVRPPPETTATSDLNIVFWNANGWNSMSCERISDTVRSSGADILCITDARMDPHKNRFLDGYLLSLRKATGKVWRGKIEHRPAKRTKCSVGGDIIFFSENCSKVSKSSLLPYGTASSLRLTWGGREIKIISVYRPYDGPESAGSLRTAVTRLDEQFEETFWDLILAQSNVSTIIGEDFIMKEKEIGKRIEDSSFSRNL